MTRREKIIVELQPYLWDHLEVATDAILAIPLDIPSDEEIKKKYGKSPFNHISGDRFAEQGAKWMRDEILKRNK